MRPSSYFMWVIPTLIIAMLAAIDGSWQVRAATFQTNNTPPVALDQIENHIILAERQIADIRPGLEKSIKWAGTPHHRTRYAIVYIHGFSASKEELFIEA